MKFHGDIYSKNSTDILINEILWKRNIYPWNSKSIAIDEFLRRYFKTENNFNRQI